MSLRITADEAPCICCNGQWVWQRESLQSFCRGGHEVPTHAGRQNYRALERPMISARTTVPTNAPCTLDAAAAAPDSPKPVSVTFAAVELVLVELPLKVELAVGCASSAVVVADGLRRGVSKALEASASLLSVGEAASAVPVGMVMADERAAAADEESSLSEGPV